MRDGEIVLTNSTLRTCATKEQFRRGEWLIEIRYLSMRERSAAARGHVPRHVDWNFSPWDRIILEFQADCGGVSGIIDGIIELSLAPAQFAEFGAVGKRQADS